MNTVSQGGDSKRRRDEEGGICMYGNHVKLNLETDIVPALTKTIRKVLAEKLEHTFSEVPAGVLLELRQSLPSGATAGTSSRAWKPYKLVFKDDLADTIYRDSKIKAREEEDVEIALYDTITNSIVTDGLLSSIKVRICALKGEFNNGSSWSTTEFKNNIFHQREDKAALLKGETIITLKKGVGRISNISFTDNSKRTRSGRYRLGAIVHSPAFYQEHVTEAVTNPFMVKESRGNKKHYPPSPKDDIWRLVNISKDGNIHKRLSQDLQIKTVEDLLRFDNQAHLTLLQKAFGQSSRKLRETIKHARSCYLPTAVTCQGQNCHSHNILNSYHHDDKQHVEETVTMAHTFPGPMGILQQQGTDFVQPSASTPQVDSAQELFVLPETTRIQGHNYVADGNWDFSGFI
ncbi:hypothetical protein PIB30_041725 [Stylosanthes scabra]|uniref:Calmodulin-binding protein 60 B-like n=1 Tax=Stylosanthes scabra TaxID=79078 RepID=A0ABU6XD01_9FABA|nr:hypothetical protein [Stylosanthes scabra]